ncbi:MAG: hypothetical protein ACYC1U_08520 [Candidatus Aquicultorales bacterium]
MDYDWLVVGSGSAGAAGAARARSLGITKIALVERAKLGGT